MYFLDGLGLSVGRLDPWQLIVSLVALDAAGSPQTDKSAGQRSNMRLFRRVVKYSIPNDWH
jgi:hypothetical protein